MGKFRFSDYIEEGDIFVDKVQKIKKKSKGKTSVRINESFHGKVVVEIGREELEKVLQSIESQGSKSPFFGLRKVGKNLEYESRMKEEFEDDLKNFKSAFKSQDINCTFTVKAK